MHLELERSHAIIMTQYLTFTRAQTSGICRTQHARNASTVRAFTLGGRGCCCFASTMYR